MFGLESLPNVGEIFKVFPTEPEACKEAKLYSLKNVETKHNNYSNTMISSNGADMNGVQNVNLIIKSDTEGSIEAIKSAISQLPQNKVTLRYLTAATGEITHSDVEIAATSKGFVFGFNTTSAESIYSFASEKGVQIRSHKIIYGLVDDVRAVMEDKLPHVLEKKYTGTAVVNAVFGGGCAGKVAGCVVKRGRIILNYTGLVRRHGNTLHESKLNSLRQKKNQVTEVDIGEECGIGIEGFKEWEVSYFIAIDNITDLPFLKSFNSNTTLFSNIHFCYLIFFLSQ
jgi:translation initiation factor IF-2